MNNDNNGWKQPIPVNLRQEFGGDHLARLIYQELLLMACNSEQVKNVNGQIIKLKRGQCYYTTLYFSKIFLTHRNSVVNALKRLNRVYNKIDNRATPKGSIATLINYDEVVKIDNRMYNEIDNRETTAGQQSDTNKSANSAKPAKPDPLTPLEGEPDEWRDLITRFAEYRKEIKKPYKSESAVRQLLVKLKEYDIDTATKMVDKSIANQWQGVVFESNGGHKPKQEQQDSDYEHYVDIPPPPKGFVPDPNNDF